MWTPIARPSSRGDAALLIGKRRVARRTKRHLWRENRCAAEVDVVGQKVAAALSHAGAVLVVGADDERQSAEPLHGVELLRRFDRRTDRHDEAADVLLGDQLVDPRPARARGRREITEELRPHQLRGLVARRERSEDGIGPGSRGAVSGKRDAVSCGYSRAGDCRGA